MSNKRIDLGDGKVLDLPQNNERNPFIMDTAHQDRFVEMSWDGLVNLWRWIDDNITKKDEQPQTGRQQ